MDFFKSAQKNFKMAKKGVEISTTPKILGGKKKCCKKLLATKNVVFQHLLPIYETIFEIYSGDFGPKMAIFGPPRQKFLRVGTSEGPISKIFFEKIIIHLLLPLCAKFHRQPTKTRKI